MLGIELIAYGAILLGLATVIAVGQQLHPSAANVSWWPL